MELTPLWQIITGTFLISIPAGAYLFITWRLAGFAAEHRALAHARGPLARG